MCLGRATCGGGCELFAVVETCGEGGTVIEREFPEVWRCMGRVEEEGEGAG